MKTLNTISSKFIGTLLFTILTIITLPIGSINAFPQNNEKEPITTELEYAADFHVNKRAYQLFVERLITTKETGSNYRLRLRYKAASTPVEDETNLLVGPDGYIEVQAEMINLSDREAFVYSLLTALQPIVDSAKAEKRGLKISDAPFDSATTSDSGREQLEEQLRDQFQEIQLGRQQLLAAPVSGIFRFVDAPQVYSKKYLKIKNPKEGWLRKDFIDSVAKKKLPLFIDSIQMQIEDGNIFNIKVHAFIEENQNKKFILFENYAPIGISTHRDLNNWHLMRLYPQKRKSTDKDKHISLGEVVEYIPSLNEKTSDFSPVSGVYTIRPGDNRIKRTFYKAQTEKLLQARIYSDLVGVDQDRPNGLIQVEVNKRFILNNNVSKRIRKVQHGFFYFVEPEITISKIEDKEKFLPLRLQSDGVANIDSVRSIDLMRYTSFKVGGTLNLGYIHIPNIKSMFLLNGRIDLNRIPFRDTVNTSSTTTQTLIGIEERVGNVVSYGLNLQLVLRPDPRYGATFQTEWTRYALTDNSIVQVPSNENHSWFEKFVEQDIFRHQISLWAKISENGELFFRTQFSHLRIVPEQNFFQAQIGYQFDVFSPRRTAPTVKPIM